MKETELKNQQVLLNFLIAEAGGKEEVYRRFYRSKIIDLANQGKTLNEMLSAASEDGWNEWLLGVKLADIADLINPTESASQHPASQQAAAKRGGTVRMTAKQRDELNGKIIVYLKSNPWSASGDVAVHVGHDSRKVGPLLAKLKREGRVVAKGERINTRYALPPEEAKPVPPIKRKKD